MSMVMTGRRAVAEEAGWKWRACLIAERHCALTATLRGGRVAHLSHCAPRTALSRYEKGVIQQHDEANAGRRRRR